MSVFILSPRLNFIIAKLFLLIAKSLDTCLSLVYFFFSGLPFYIFGLLIYLKVNLNLIKLFHFRVRNVWQEAGEAFLKLFTLSLAKFCKHIFNAFIHVIQLNKTQFHITGPPFPNLDYEVVGFLMVSEVPSSSNSVFLLLYLNTIDKNVELDRVKEKFCSMQFKVSLQIQESINILGYNYSTIYKVTQF